LGEDNFINVAKFNKVNYVHIREWYTSKNGTPRPGANGKYINYVKKQKTEFRAGIFNQKLKKASSLV
jgi:hypothetical protein